MSSSVHWAIVPPTQNSASSGCAMITSTRSTSRSDRRSTIHLHLAGSMSATVAPAATPHSPRRDERTPTLPTPETAELLLSASRARQVTISMEAETRAAWGASPPQPANARSYQEFVGDHAE